MGISRKEHWEKVYRTRPLEDVGWYQPRPETSLDFIEKLNIPLAARIIDVGGGDSLLVDHLLDLGFEDLTVLDISSAAIERAQQRLGDRASGVKWIIKDVVKYDPDEKYDLWHDRAAFHFLTNEEDISRYVSIAEKGVKPGGHLVIGSFSEEGPHKCSGLEITQYSERSLSQRFERSFRKIESLKVDHTTPSGALQNYIFCSFKREPRPS